MKKQLTVALSIAVLSGILTLGCDDDNDSTQESSCKTEGFVNCNGTCIDPTTSKQYCGANEYCEGFVACKDTETCFNGRCRPTNCEPDEHYHDVVCEKDSAEHCGEHGVKCADKVEGWKSGTCVDKSCKLDACNAGLHIFENTCEQDDANHCGSHDTDCSKEIAGWADGTCEDGACRVSACQSGLHAYNDACEADDVENCGAHGTSCSLTVNGWASGDCLQSACTVKTCAEGMHVFENACELDDVDNCGLHGRSCASTVAGWKAGACTQGACKLLQCIDGYHVDDKTGGCVQDTAQCCGAACTKCKDAQVCGEGQCRDSCPANTLYCDGACVDVQNSVDHCGECGKNCNNAKPDHAKTMLCAAGACTINECAAEYHIEKQDDKLLCKADTITACGKEVFDCTSHDWWDSGSCTNGTCIPNSCKGDYHPAKNDLDQNWCEPDSAQNCGEHGHACSGGQQCAGGRCLGNTICDDVLRNTLTDLEHCGACNHRCDDGLICDRGTCKLGTGQAYCSGQKVTMGTIDRCSSCQNRCADSLICKDNACVSGAGMTHCSDVTLNTLSDVDHCGSCNNKCGNGLICSEGKCQTGNGVMYCSGVKIDSTNDSAHCSGCGNKCAAGSKCEKTSNIVACSDGIGSTYCSGMQRNTANDSANCGQCGKKCGVGQICTSGSCQTGSGTTSCDGKSIDTSKDSANCGMCGNICGIGKICQNGTCTAGTGVTYCDGKSINNTNHFLNCGQCSNACAKNKICQNGTCSEPKVGDVISFGQYKILDAQTITPIQWYILDKDTVNHRVMILSMDVLEKRPYHTKNEAVTWAESTIRSWLNGYGKSENKQSLDFTSSTFISSAFTSEERARIPSVQIVNANNPQYGITGGVNTNDKVFLLSIDEVKTLLGTTMEDICTKIHCTAHWWLRSPGSNTYYAASVSNGGSLYARGNYVHDDRNFGVRPALWISY